MLKKYENLRDKKEKILGTAMDTAAVDNPLHRNDEWYRLGAVICMYSKMYNLFPN
jgi:hypothetical protein